MWTNKITKKKRRSLQLTLLLGNFNRNDLALEDAFTGCFLTELVAPHGILILFLPPYAVLLGRVLRTVTLKIRHWWTNMDLQETTWKISETYPHKKEVGGGGGEEGGRGGGRGGETQRGRQTDRDRERGGGMERERGREGERWGERGGEREGGEERGRGERGRDRDR